MKTTHIEPAICCCTCLCGEDVGDVLDATATNTKHKFPDLEFCCS